MSIIWEPFNIIERSDIINVLFTIVYTICCCLYLPGKKYHQMWPTLKVNGLKSEETLELEPKSERRGLLLRYSAYVKLEYC